MSRASDLDKDHGWGRGRMTRGLTQICWSTETTAMWLMSIDSGK